MTGPDAAKRRRETTHVWGEAANAAGEIRVARVHVANGYDVTIHASLAVTADLMGRTPRGGAYTPSQLVGKSLVERLPGSERVTIGAE